MLMMDKNNHEIIRMILKWISNNPPEMGLSITTVKARL